MTPEAIASAAKDPTAILLGLATLVASLFAGRRALQNNTNVNLRSKRADAIMHCNSRYHELYDLRIRAEDAINSGNIDDSVKTYYGRFWGLKSDQFDYWLADLVDIETFCNWSYQTAKSFYLSFKRETKDGTTSFSFDRGWIEIGRLDHVVTNEWFYELTEALRQIGAAWASLERRTEGQTMLHPEDKIHLQSIAEIREFIHSEIAAVLDIAFHESARYRHLLRKGMTLQSYLRTRRKSRTLGLLMKDRASSLRMELPASLLDEVPKYAFASKPKLVERVASRLPYTFRRHMLYRQRQSSVAFRSDA